jgi:4-deoxy-L-threo-5-hexosulose-uronate ketol-isomerase
MKLNVRYASHQEDAKHYTTEKLREHYLIEQVFVADEAVFTYSHFDRIIAGGVMPVSKAVELTGSKEMASESFLERREMGVINIGGKGAVIINGQEYEMKKHDGIYIGMGNETISFKSADPQNPAKFYLNSAPAHKTYDIVKIDIAKANAVNAGDNANLNKRVLYQYLHPNVCKTCQLSMGLTMLEPGNAWNTMPSHTHERRMEVYLYFNLPADQAVFHMMGQPQETRHIVLKNEQAVISPSWSIHSGVGTTNYTFIWGMCGENQEFTDMDGVQTQDIL